MAWIISAAVYRSTTLPLCALDPTVLLALRQCSLPCTRALSAAPRSWYRYNGSSSYIHGRKQSRKYLTCTQCCHGAPPLLNIAATSLLNTGMVRSQHTQAGSGANTSIQIAQDKMKTPSLKVKKYPSTQYKRLFKLASPEKWTLISAIGLLAVSSTITMAVPFALGQVIDIIYTEDAVMMKQNLDRLCLMLGGVFLTGGAANFGRVYLMNVAGQRITRTLRAAVFGSLLKQEIGFFDSNKTGELINRLSADTLVVSQSVTMNISDGLRSCVMAMAGVGMMFYMSAELAMVGLSIVPPVALMAIAYGRYLRRITKTVQDTLAQATQVAEERISNVRTVRSFAQEPKEIQTYNDKVNHVLQMTYKESLAKGIFFGMTGLSGNIIILSVLYYGGGLVAESAITVGQLSSFLLYAAYVGIAMGGISSFYSEMNRGLGASVRLLDLMDRTPLIPIEGGLKPSVEEIKGEIRFRNISFHYPSRPDVSLFENLDFAVPSGSIVAVVGSSGSGKSTIASLLLRLYDPISGDITIDGTSITHLDPAWLRAAVGSVSQEPVLFSSSIRENLLYGAQDPNSVTEEQLLTAAKEANALSFINSFPDGLETLVGERGVMLSGGQKQRIAIARALISNPRILLLDEATSALDAESESLVQEALERLMQGRTVITIAHRLSTIRNADQIAVLDKGVIAELGTYKDLMTVPDGIFRKLVERQTITS